VGYVVSEFHFVVRTSDGEHRAICVSGARDLAVATQLANSSGVSIVSNESNQQVAAQKAAAINAANGIVVPGCSRC
jgi:hypothetical protein